MDLGEIPARFQINKLVLNYLQQILQESENTLMGTFFQVHPKHQRFHKIVEGKISTAAFIHLKSKIKSKGEEINYGNQLAC